MQLFDWQLNAGESTKWYGACRYLRLIECSGIVDIEVEYEGGETDRVSSKLIRGIGVDLSHPISKARVKTIAFKSDVSQVLTVLASEFPTADSRLSGSVTVGSGGSLLNTPHATLAAAGTANIAANVTRRAITVGVYSTESGSLHAGQGGSTNAGSGVEIQPGMTFRFETTAAISIYNPQAVGVKYYVLEEF